MSESCWVGLALDQIEQHLIIVCFGNTEEEARGRLDRDEADTPYRAVFNLNAESAESIRDWLRSCGVVDSDLRPLLSSLSDSLVEVFNISGKRFDGPRTA